ncbi:MAG: branched-chain amino acid ABC transporter permease [Promethearchaeota archaeon]|jgi:branched-chain amino acid transport system permease protein
MSEIVIFLFNGTLNGAVFSLVALGYSLVYGVGHIMNLSHGAYFMLSGYLLLWLLDRVILINTAIALTFNILLVIIIITALGGLTYLLLIKPLQDTSVGVVLVTFGLAFLFENLVLIAFGVESYSLNQYSIPNLLNLIGFGIPSTNKFLEDTFGTLILNQFIFLIIISLLIVVIFAAFINYSKLGKSIRAVSQDREAASLMGINSNRILLYTVMISAFLASVAGVLYIPAAAINGPTMGWEFLTNSFAVVILGGMGSLVGSIVGAYIVGFITSFTSLFIPNGPSWAHIVPIIVIVIMLIIRPQGLFGKKEVR